MRELTAKEIIENTRVVLGKNIVLTEELAKQLIKHNLIGESALKELQACTTQEVQNDKLLHLLGMRGRIALETFCDVLQMTGFNFLSDMLRDQLMTTEGDAVDISDLGKKAPRVDKALDRREKEDLTKYIQQKVHEIHLKQAWQKNTNEKEKTMVAKQKQLEESWKFTDMLQDKDNTIKQMSEQLESAFKDAESKGVHLQHVSQYLSQMKQKHTEDMKIQMQYNQANDNSLRRQTQKYGDMEKELQMLATQIHETLVQGGQIRSESSQSNSHDMILTTLDQVKFSMNKLLTHTRELQSMKKHHDKLSEDCYYVLSHLGTDVKADLRESFQSFIVENEELTVSLRNQIEVLKRELEQKEASVRERIENANNKICDLQSQLEESVSTSLQKEAKNKALDAEIEKLKKTIASLEKQLMSKQQSYNRRPSTPRFKDYAAASNPDTPIGRKSPKRHSCSPEHHLNVTPSNDNMNTPKRDNRYKPQQGVTLPSIHRNKGKPAPYGMAGSVPVTRTQDMSMYNKTRANAFANSSSPFIVQSIGGNVGKAKALGTYQNTYGKQHSVEVEMKKGVPYYR